MSILSNVKKIYEEKDIDVVNVLLSQVNAICLLPV
jgi:hypothetical protein